MTFSDEQLNLYFSTHTPQVINTYWDAYLPHSSFTPAMSTYMSIKGRYYSVYIDGKDIKVGIDDREFDFSMSAEGTQIHGIDKDGHFLLKRAAALLAKRTVETVMDRQLQLQAA